MRMLACTIMAIATIMAGSPARAQTYDPSFPVCMHLFGGMIAGGDYFDCSFTSLPQCRATASGRSAQCIINPYYAYAAEPSGRAYRRQRPAY